MTHIKVAKLRMTWLKRHPHKQAGLMFHINRGACLYYRDKTIFPHFMVDGNQVTSCGYITKTPTSNRCAIT